MLATNGDKLEAACRELASCSSQHHACCPSLIGRSLTGGALD
jgi:hypothetical protein